MKSSLILSAVLLMSQGAFAEAEGQFAVLKPDFACTVNPPKGSSSSQVYFSKDCQTAYVLPSLNMKKTVLKPYYTADSGICNRYEQTIESMSEIETEVRKIRKVISDLRVKMSLTTDESQMRSLQDSITYFNQSITELKREKDTALAPFYNTPAMRAQVRVESDIMDEVAAFQLANLNSVSLGKNIYPTRFAPAQITDALLAISAVDGLDAKSVLKVDFPATRYIPSAQEKNDYPVGSTLLNMNGSMSGVVDLSAVSYCRALASTNQQFNSEMEKMVEIFKTAVALNADFKVKVQAGVKLHMKSTINAKDFLNEMNKKVVDTLYTRDVFYGALVSGGLMNTLTIDVDDKGSEIDLAKVIFSEDSDSTIENLNPIVPLINKFISNHLKMVENKLISLNVLTLLSEEQFTEKKAATTTEISHYESICSSSRSWFKKTTSCSLQPVYMQVNHNGISQAIGQISDDSNIENEVTFETNQTTTVRHTSTFGK